MAAVEYVQKRDETLIVYQLIVASMWLLGLTTIVPSTA
jgi:hypothetical protein